MTAGFKDHFSVRSDNYAEYRPTYPVELFQFLASVTEKHSVAWDCATGSGQVALGLAVHFKKVIASDASPAQIAAALAHPQVEYRVASAERSGLAAGSVDLLTVGQAYHWFDAAVFLTEAQRVLSPSGVLAIWCYERCVVDPDIDVIVERLYNDIAGEYWPPERVLIEDGYACIDLPGAPVAAPLFEMSLDWRVSDMLGYLRTWSACRRYESEKGTDPVSMIEAVLHEAWGDGAKRVIWPLHIKASRANRLLE